MFFQHRPIIKVTSQCSGQTLLFNKFAADYLFSNSRRFRSASLSNLPFSVVLQTIAYLTARAQHSICNTQLFTLVFIAVSCISMHVMVDKHWMTRLAQITDIYPALALGIERCCNVNVWFIHHRILLHSGFHLSQLHHRESQCFHCSSIYDCRNICRSLCMQGSEDDKYSVSCMDFFQCKHKLDRSASQPLINHQSIQARSHSFLSFNCDP